MSKTKCKMFRAFPQMFTFTLGFIIVIQNARILAVENQSNTESTRNIEKVLPNETQNEIVEVTESNNLNRTLAVNLTEDSTENETEVETTTEMFEVSGHLVDDPAMRERRIELEDYCLCDLMAFSCDINCCCDNDCTEEQKNVFSHCKTNMKKYNDEEFCIQEDFVYKNNSILKSRIISNGLLCIVTDNIRDKHFFPTAKGVKSTTEYEKLMRRIGFTSWERPSNLLDEDIKLNVHGAPLWTIGKDGFASTFELPSSFPSSNCDGRETMYFLENFEEHCRIRVKNIKEQCETEKLFDSTQYLDLVFLALSQLDSESPDENATTATEPPTVQPPTQSSITKPNSAPPSNVTDEPTDEAETETTTTSGTQQYTLSATKQAFNYVPVTVFLCHGATSDYLCNQIPSVSKPNYADERCDNVLRNLFLTIFHSGSNGIQEVHAIIHFQSVTVDSEYIRQEYSLNHEWIEDNSTSAFRKSGNPGYLLGKPVLMGHLFTNDSSDKEESKILLDTNAKNWLTVASTGPNMLCDYRTPVNFGEDIFSGCELVTSLNQSSEICQSVQTEILNLLLGSLIAQENNLQIGMFGNSNVNYPEEWVPLLKDDKLQDLLFAGEIDSDDEQTNLRECEVVTSIRIEILFALQGPVDKPQAKVVGAIIKSGQPIKLDISQFESVNGTFRPETLVLDLHTSVIFIDVTKKSVREYPEPPSFDLKLPHDFFYPFLPSNSLSSKSMPFVLIICLSLYCSH